MIITKDPAQFLLAEYAQLKAEILKRSEFQHQLISIALVALGALVSVGLKESPIAVLAYPMLALFLSALWIYNDGQIAQLGIYIQYRIEENLIGEGLGWEHAIKADPVSPIIGKRIRIATRGILIGSELMAIGLYAATKQDLATKQGIRLSSLATSLSKGEMVLLVVDLVVIFVTFWIMRHQHLREKMKEAIQRARSESPPAVWCG
ncbi:MAG: hypothetical protein DMF70_07220 [Acidobacteria bacterium]|nr:MAG: hypothetical protein DMF70_07220 [Acidobacteriota bacterium]